MDNGDQMMNGDRRGVVSGGTGDRGVTGNRVQRGDR